METSWPPYNAFSNANNARHASHDATAATVAATAAVAAATALCLWREHDVNADAMHAGHAMYDTAILHAYNAMGNARG